MSFSRFLHPSLVAVVLWASFIGQWSIADTATKKAISSQAATQSVTFDIFKSPTCPCCEKWITHLESRGFTTVIHHPDDMNVLKTSRGIAPRYQSCHTAVSPEGYVFEGHIPASVIQRFLIEKPKGAIGLAVPGMPMGSPGMEMGSHFNPYDVLLLKADGSSAVYIRITSIDQQY